MKDLRICYIFSLVLGILFLDIEVGYAYDTPVAIDSRMKMFIYSPSEIFEIKGHHEYKTFIEFAPGEQITYYKTGDGVSWSIEVNDMFNNILVVQPLERHSHTNLIVFTNKRKYVFDMIAKDKLDPEIAYSVRFFYADDQDISAYTKGSGIDNTKNPKNHPAKKDDGVLESQYSVLGDRSISPIEVFDNSHMTFLKFNLPVEDLPKVYKVSEDNSEESVKMVFTDGYVVIEGVYDALRLRYDKKLANVTRRKN